MMPPDIREMTPDERIKFREMLLRHRAQLLIFTDDIRDLIFQADNGNDAYFDSVLYKIMHKLQIFSEAEEAEVFGLKKEVGDEPPRAKRTYGHVVPSKREKARRESGGGNVTSQRDPFNVPGMWDDDDDIPF